MQTNLHEPTTPTWGRGGGRAASPAYREALIKCEDFSGLEEGADRYQLLLLVKRVGRQAGFTPRMITLLDYYMAFTGGGESEGATHQESKGQALAVTGAVAESRHTAPLLPIDQIINRYSKHNPSGERLALVQVCGLGFFEVERIRYWEHPAFYRCFSKDPDHDFVQAPKPAHVVEQERRAEERSPAAVAELKQQFQALQAEDDEVATYRPVVHAAQWLLALGVPLALLAGSWVAPVLPAIGSFACYRTRQFWSQRHREIRELSERIAHLEQPE